MNRHNDNQPQRVMAYPDYKHSGVDWLGEIPAHWHVERLKYLATANDEVLSESTEPEFEMNYVDIGNVDAAAGITAKETLAFDQAPSRARRIVRNGDVIVSTVRTYLRAITAIQESEPSLIVSTGFAVLRPRKLESSFASYALRAPHFVERMVANSVGVSYPAINASDLGCFEVAYPGPDEQRAIAGFLDRETARIDALVAKKERLIELLQEKRTALITRGVTRGLDPNVPMRDSGVTWLGEIPAHWNVKRLKYLVPRTTVGIVVTPSKYYVDEGVPCLRSLNVSRGVIDMDDLVFISEAANELHRKSKIFAGDVVVVRTGQAGTAAVVPEELDGANCIDLLIVRCSEHLVSRFTYYYLNSRTATSQAAALSVGAIQAHYNTSTLAQLVFPEIPRDEQHHIADFLDERTAEIDALTARIQQAIELLNEYRTALISAAVTGKIDVRKEAA